jgi:2-methylcitrate dehydratase PrpD
MHMTQVLAQHVQSITPSQCPAEVRELALRCILDLVGAAIAGHTIKSSLAARGAGNELLGDGCASIWMVDRMATPISAVMSNTAAASALDIDDGNRAARGHPGACVIPAVLTFAPVVHATADEVLSAIIAGYEIGVRVAAAQNPLGISTRQTGRWAALATVGAMSSLFKVEPDAVSQALAIAGVLAPNQQANGSSGYSRLTGNDVKEGIPWSVATGLMALSLARHGYTGPLDLLDYDSHYDAKRLLSGMGRRWEISDTYFKPYACCRYIHPALDRVFELVGRYDLAPGDVVSVEVQTFGWAARLGNAVRPATLVEIQYSLPYCVAVALVEGRNALVPTSECLLGREDITRLARKVKIELDPDIDRLFPGETLARVVVETRTHRHVSELGGPLGDPRRPMGWPAMEAKFLILTRKVLSRSKQKAVLDGVLSAAAGDIGPLLRELRRKRSS